MLTGVLLSQVPLTDYRLDYRQNITGHAVSGVGGNYPHSSNQECRMLHAGHTCRRWAGYELLTGAYTDTMLNAGTTGTIRKTQQAAIRHDRKLILAQETNGAGE